MISAIRILPEYERGVVFRLGRLRPMDYGPGLFLLIPIVDRMVRVSLRTIVMDVPEQDVITKDKEGNIKTMVYGDPLDPSDGGMGIYYSGVDQLSPRGRELDVTKLIYNYYWVDLHQAG